MAADELLLQNSSRPTLRLYTWSEPTLSLGYSQRTDWIDWEGLQAQGVAAVRRPTGGRALLHDREITYSVVLPRGGSQPIGAAYALITGLLAAALVRLGVPVSQAERSDPIPASRAAPGCMGFVQRGELVISGAKLVGSAQARRGSRLLQHGTIPWDSRDRMRTRLIPASAPTTDLKRLGIGPIEPRELARAFVDTGLVLEECAWTATELASRESLRERFRLLAPGRRVGFR